MLIFAWLALAMSALPVQSTDDEPMRPGLTEVLEQSLAAPALAATATPESKFPALTVIPDFRRVIGPHALEPGLTTEVGWSGAGRCVRPRRHVPRLGNDDPWP